jgi:hypothetical protein
MSAGLLKTKASDADVQVTLSHHEVNTMRSFGVPPIIFSGTKGNTVPVHPMSAYTGSKTLAALILNPGTSAGKW